MTPIGGRSERAGPSPPPRLALTVGDVAGVGPEVIVRSLAQIAGRIDPVVFGPQDAFERAAQLVGVPLQFRHTAEIPDAAVDAIACVDAAGHETGSIRPGTVDPRAGRIAYDSLSAAIDAALAGQVDGIVTAPLNKLALHQAGYDVPGHTEILARACGAQDVAMMLYLPPGPIVAAPHGLGVGHVTLHTSIASVPELLTVSGVGATIRLVEEFMRQIGCPAPRIGVCALNPHAGEGGLFGNEESEIIAPAVADAHSAERIDARGPFPADTLLKRAVAGEFDGVVAMYHDQGHIAIKLIAFHSAVNVTLGLPIIRTSPTQGTAFDIAWRGVAKPDGMIAAIEVAAQLVEGRRSGGAEGQGSKGAEVGRVQDARPHGAAP